MAKDKFNFGDLVAVTGAANRYRKDVVDGLVVAIKNGIVTVVIQTPPEGDWGAGAGFDYETVFADIDKVEKK